VRVSDSNERGNVLAETLDFAALVRDHLIIAFQRFALSSCVDRALV